MGLIENAPTGNRTHTGHSSKEMNAVYTHHELEPLRAAIATLPKIASK